MSPEQIEEIRGRAEAAWETPGQSDEHYRAQAQIMALLSSLQAAQEEIERWRNNADNERERADDAQTRVAELEGSLKGLDAVLDFGDPVAPTEGLVITNPSALNAAMEAARQALSEGQDQ